MRPCETPITLFGSLKLGALCCSGALGCSLVSLVVNRALISDCGKMSIPKRSATYWFNTPHGPECQSARTSKN